ncbi:MAG TPA: glycosyltransferase, partial [Chthoniobacterales bacterium]|nr:glycosyltransferase [Chthoniobacterales bacterium]
MRPGSYEEWVRRYDTITSVDRDALRAQAARMPRRPLISILLPIYDPQLDWLAEAIESVKAQTYPHWELCMADDASTKWHVRPFLKQQAASDPRIKLVFRAANGHIS